MLNFQFTLTRIFSNIVSVRTLKNSCKIKIDSAGLSKIETGHKKMKPETLPLVAEVFSLEIDKLKEQYYGEEIAQRLYKYNCPETALIVAEERVKYIKQRSAKQGSLNFNP